MLADVALGGAPALSRRWLPATAALTASAYATACYLPSIWDALTLVGATSTTVQSWIMPALIILCVERRGRGRGDVGGGGSESGGGSAGGGSAGKRRKSCRF